MKNIKLRFIGTSPLLLSCDKLSDPIDHATIEYKKWTSIRGAKKTEEVHATIARLQWEGGLYWDNKIGVYMPSQNIKASIISGAKQNKLGATFKRGTLILDEKIPLDYGKKLTIQQLWDNGFIDRRSVVVGQARVPAYRPKFLEWKFDFDFLYDEDTLDESHVLEAAIKAGRYFGIGGYRPENGGIFGRFDVEVIK